MKRVTGIGGIFIQYKDPKQTREWYSKHLGLKTEEYGTSFEWRDVEDPSKKGSTLWGTFAETTTYFQPSEKSFMLNFRVDNLAVLVEQLKVEGIEVLGEIQDTEFGKFAHIMDPEGNKIELWEDVSK